MWNEAVFACNYVLSEENNRQYQDGKSDLNMTKWEENNSDYWEAKLDTDYKNYLTCATGPDGTKVDGLDKDEWDHTYNTDQTSMQTETEETDSEVKTLGGAVSTDSTNINQCVTACSYANKVSEYLSSIIKSKL